MSQNSNFANRVQDNWPDIVQQLVNAGSR